MKKLFDFVEEILSSKSIFRLFQGQTVQFRIQRTNKGEEARDVSLFSNETEQEETSSSSINPGERQTGIVRR